MKCGPKNNIINSSITGDKSLFLELSYSLNDPVDKLVFTRLENPNLITFSLACKRTAQWTKDAREIREISFLLECVAKGNQDEAKRILRSKPKLLLSTKGEAVDYSGKKVKYLTAFQVALCAGDVEMCNMIKEHFNTFENGLELLKKQYDTIFPQGIEAYSQEHEKSTFDFSEIFEAILDAPDDEIENALNKKFDNTKALHKALGTFRQAFDTLSHSSKIFNPSHLHKAFTLYNENFDAAQSWNKRDLIWRQVVGYTQRHLPACYVQAFAQGLEYLVQEIEPLQRSFHFRRGSSFIFPLAGTSDLGFDFACGEFGSLFEAWGRRDADSVHSTLGAFISKINNKLGTELFRQNHNFWCVVC